MSGTFENACSAATWDFHEKFLENSELRLSCMHFEMELWCTPCMMKTFLIDCGYLLIICLNMDCQIRSNLALLVFFYSNQKN